MAFADSTLAETRGEAHVDNAWAIKHGLIGGAIGAIVFAMAEMVESLMTNGNFFMPLHMIAGIPLQTEPMKIDPLLAGVVGMLSHMMYSMMVGVVVAFIVASVEALRRSPVNTVIFATVLGLVSHPVNFYLIAPIINAPWFPNDTNPVTQALWHAMFGLVLGAWLARQLPAARGSRTAGA